MPPLKLLTVVSALFLVLTKTTDAAATNPTYSVTVGSEGQCLADINAARQIAGLSELVQAKTSNKLPAAAEIENADTATYKNWVWYPVCETLLTTNKPEAVASSSVTGGKFPTGTYAYYKAGADTVDCKSVLKQWKDAYKNFEGLPPKYSADAPQYQNTDNVSLVAIYNPLENATADCRMVTCTKTPATADGSSPASGYALLCLTAPDALQKASPKSPPFSQDQWDKIVSAIKGSASAASPSVVGFVAAILGFSIMML